MLLMLERRDEAVTYLEKLTAATPDFLPVWALLGEIAFHDKDDERATQYFAKVFAKDPVEVNTSLMQGEIFLRAKEPEKALALLEKVAAALPSRPQIDLALAKCYLLTEKPARAAEALDRVLAVSPDAIEAARLRAQIQLQDGKTAEAITALEAINKRAPEDAASRDLLIAAYRSAGRNDEAVALMRDKAAGDDKAGSRIELGQLLNAQGKLAEARSIFEDAVETFGDNLSAVSNLAAIDLREGKGDAALARLDDYIAKHPESSEAQTFKAGVALGLKKLELAEESLEKAIVLKPENAQAYGLLLQMKGSPGQEKEALAVLERYLAVYPEDPQALLQRGYLLQQLGRNEEARAAFLALTETNPDFAPAFNNLASLEADFFELESAATHARKARSLDASEPAIADTLGWIEWRLGNYSAALALLTEAAGKLGDNAEVLYHLGKAHYSMGQAAEAGEAFTKALASSPDFPQKEDAVKQLELLGAAGSGDLQALEKRVTENPKDVMAHLQLAELLVRSDKPQEALAAYQKALDANPAIPVALVGQTRLYGGPLNSPEKALAAATEARKLAPRDPKVLAALGYAMLLTGEDEEAYGLLKDASGRLEDDADVVFDFARAAYHLGQISEARAAMTRVAGLDAPVSAAAKKFLLLTDAEALEQPGIAEEVEATLAGDSKNVPALMLRASLDAAAGKSPEVTYQEILGSHPRFDPARVRLAAVYVEDPEKLDQALLLANEARSRLPDEPELTRVLALASYRKADFRYAAQLLAELAIRRPLAPEELLVLGLSQANSDQPGKARESLDAALKAGLPEAAAAEAKAALVKLDEAE
jgi:tetratricopeptide (TPR) repeat protein